jgi:hypothetical protein
VRLDFPILPFLQWVFFLAHSICDKVIVIYDASGNYARTACFVLSLVPWNYLDAKNVCKFYGFDFFNVEIPSDLDAILATANSKYGTGTFWIEGRNGDNCNVIQRPLFSTFQKTTISCGTPTNFICQLP